MGQVRYLIGTKGASAASVVGPAEHPGLEEGAIEDQLRAALEQIEQAYLTFGPVELILLLHRHPRHPSAFGGQRVTEAGQGLLLYEELLARSLPLLLRDDRGCFHHGISFPRPLVRRHFHFSLLFRCGTISSAAFFLREAFTANAASPPVETAPATTIRMVAKQNGHIGHLLGGQFDRSAASLL